MVKSVKNRNFNLDTLTDVFKHDSLNRIVSVNVILLLHYRNSSFSHMPHISNY